METNKILQADILDILFEGRNKDYGAYQLRKTYNRRLVYSMAVMFGIAMLAVAGTVLGKTNNTQKPTLFVQDLSLLSVKQEAVIPPPPVVPPPPKDPPKVEIKQFTNPLLVSHDVKEPPPTQDILDNTNIGTINQDGIKTEIVAPPVEPGTGLSSPPKVEEDIFKEFKTVQIQAQFPGGLEAWQKYLTRNLRVDVPLENGAAAGNYKVVVSFLVDREGNISEVRAEIDPGYGTAAEAIRVIERGPKWNPAIQNGRNVIYRQKQTITFQVNDNQ